MGQMMYPGVVSVGRVELDETAGGINRLQISQYLAQYLQLLGILSGKSEGVAEWKPGVDCPGGIYLGGYLL